MFTNSGPRYVLINGIDDIEDEDVIEEDDDDDDDVDGGGDDDGDNDGDNDDLGESRSILSIFTSSSIIFCY